LRNWWQTAIEQGDANGSPAGRAIDNSPRLGARDSQKLTTEITAKFDGHAERIPERLSRERSTVCDAFQS
jgi:hypothetical protein